jgi:hypothetical protein
MAVRYIVKDGMQIHGTFSMDVPAAQAKIDGTIKRAQVFLDSKIQRDMSPFTPWKSGDMERSLIGVGTGLLKHDIIYARLNYYGDSFNFGKVPHPLAGARWFERAKSARKEKWRSETQNFINKGA